MVHLLPYIEEFIMESSVRKVITEEDWWRVSREVDIIFRSLALVRHNRKWKSDGGCTCIEKSG